VDADLVSGVEGLEVNGAEGTVILESRWAVDQRVLAAKLFFNFAKAGGHVLDADGVEGLTAGGFGYDAEYLIAPALPGIDVGADGVDYGVGTLARFDSVGVLGAAVVIVTIGN